MTIDRRTFLRWAAAGAGLALDLDALSVSAAERPLLGVAVDADPGLATRRAVELAGGWGRFVPRGSRVVVKPNIGWDRRPEQGANTHPGVVRAIVEGCLEAGAAAVAVFDRTCNDARLCYRSSGIQEAVEKIEDKRVSIFIPDRRKYVPVDIKRGGVLSRWSFYEDALRADVFINVPVLKHHGLCGVTAGLKNVMGILGDNRGEIHQNFKEKIVDLNTVIVPRLTVLDASRILLRHGPQGGDPKDVRVANTVVAGTDPVAVDAFGAVLFGVEPSSLDYLVRAAERGLGIIDLSRAEVRRG